MLFLRKKNKENPHFEIPASTVDLLVRREIVTKEFVPGNPVSLSDYVEVMVYETHSPNTHSLIHVSLFENKCTKGAFKGLWVICDELEAKQWDGNPLHFLKVGEGRIRFSENPTLKLPLEIETVTSTV